MATLAQTRSVTADRPRHGPHLDKPLHPAGRWVFVAILIGGVAYAIVSILTETHQVGESLAIGAFLFLGLALLVALGFEFVNGFHDTANAVATVIYTHAMSPPVAVVWSGVWNFIGVMVSSGAVAYSIITLLPVDLILHVGSAAGYAMIFGLLLAAVIWNLATWFVGIPNSSSHALIGSILGVGVANQLINGGSGTSGVDWGQAEKVLAALLFSPLVGFFGALVLLFAMKRVLRDRTLYEEPEGRQPPPRGIRALLVFTCTAVSFAHGSNDGQKGMGLIMLILIGVAPTAYALNRTVSDAQTPAFVQSANRAAQGFVAMGGTPGASVEQARATLTGALKSKQATTPEVYGAAATLSADIGRRVRQYGSIRQVPAAATPNLRNDMYLVFDTATLITEDEEAVKALPAPAVSAVTAYEKKLEEGTRYIPTWVKVAVAIALGLGTMIGWKRIVVTVGEKIGKIHLTYGMGAAAELTAASTILLAVLYGMPVSTTHILSSGVAGASVANGAGLQRRTVLAILSAWVLTLPAAMLLAGLLYWLLLAIVRAMGLS